MANEPIESDLPVPGEVIRDAVPYPEEAKPVFVGHYWRRGSRPALLRGNVAKGGFLCAYRWDGERVLDEERFVWAE